MGGSSFPGSSYWKATMLFKAMNYREKHHSNAIIKSNIFVIVVVKDRDFCLWLLEIVSHIILSIIVLASSKRWRRMNIGETMSEKKEEAEEEDCRKRWRGAEEIEKNRGRRKRANKTIRL